MEVREASDDEPRLPELEALPAAPAPAQDAAPAAAEEGTVQLESFAAALEAVEVLRSVDDKQAHDAFNVSDNIVLDQVENMLDDAAQDNDDVSSVASSTDVPGAESTNTLPQVPSSPGPGGPDEPPEKPALTARAVGAHALKAAKRAVQMVWYETSLLLLLVPYAIGFVSRPEEPLRLRWDLWLLRPLYALILARLGVYVLYGIKGAAVALELLPTRANIIAEAFRGWPATTIVWLGFHAIFYYAPFFDGAAWQRLRIPQWLIAVQYWLAALAITRGLLDASTERFFRSLKDGHFEQRVADAIMSMRVLRLLFSTARAARTRAAQRERAAGGARVTHARTSSVVGGSTSMTSRMFSKMGGRARTAEDGVGSGGPSLNDLPLVQHEEPPAPEQPGGGGGGRAIPSSASRARLERHGARGASHGEESELMVSEDGLFKGSLLGSLSEQLEVLQGAVAAGSGFVTSSADARKRARHAFTSLLAEFHNELRLAEHAGTVPPVSGEGVPDGCLPRERLVRWCVKATRRKRQTFRKKVGDRATALFPAEYVDEERFTTAIEAAYREQRFLSASVQSFDALNTHVHAFLVSIWAGVLFLAGIFLVDWGVDFDAWIVPISSSLLSVAFLLGWLPYESAAGILFVLVVRPYDIGDRVLITNPGVSGEGYEGYTVAKIGLLSTTLVSWQGEIHTVMNFTSRKLSIINLHRSHNPTVAITLQVPSSTPGPKISEMIDAVRAFVEHAPEDWLSISSGMIKKADYRTGVLEVVLFLKSAMRRIEDGIIDQAKNRLYMFIHVYMQTAGLEYMLPPQKIYTSIVNEQQPAGAWTPSTPRARPASGSAGGSALSAKWRHVLANAGARPS